MNSGNGNQTPADPLIQMAASVADIVLASDILGDDGPKGELKLVIEPPEDPLAAIFGGGEYVVHVYEIADGQGSNETVALPNASEYQA